MGVPGGTAYLNNCGICVGGTSGVELVNAWPFDELADWTLNARVTGYTNSGVAYLNIIGNDPFMDYNKSVCIDAHTNKFLKLNVKNNANGGGATFYFQNDVSNVWKFVTVSISQNDAELKSYVVDLSKSADWIGNIHKIRFDPPGNSGAFEIDYLKIAADDFPVSTSEFSKNVGLEIIPNPAVGKVLIRSQQASEIEIFTISGQKIYQSEDMGCEHRINIGSWNPGIYLVNSWSGKNLLTKKMVVR